MHAHVLINPLRMEYSLFYFRPKLYCAVNALHLDYKNQSVSAV